MQGTLHTCMFCAAASMLLLTSSSTATARLVMMQSERSFSITCWGNALTPGVELGTMLLRLYDTITSAESSSC